MPNDDGTPRGAQPKSQGLRRRAGEIGGVTNVPSKDAKVTIMLVTAAMATRWLSPAMNPQNRKMRKIDYFVNLIRNGQFMFTGESIQFAGSLDAGTALLLNGQHRLAAIARTGVAQWVVVVEGVDAKVMPHLDTGIRRKFADHLHIKGVSSSQLLAAITSLHMVIDDPSIDSKSMLGGSGGGNLFTFADLNEHYDKHEALFQASLYQARRVKGVFSANDTAAGTVWCLLHERTAAELDEIDGFFNRLVTDGLIGGVRSSRAKAPPMEMLRRWMTNSVKLVKPRPRSTTQAAYLIKAWNYEQEGVLIGQLVWKPAVEDFPDIL